MTTITLRSVKGSALSHTEADDNFNNLNQDKVETSAGVTADANLTDDALVRGKGGALGTQTTGITVNDSDVISLKGVALALTTVSASGSTETLTIDNGTVFDVTMDANCTFTFSTTLTATKFMLILRQDPTGSRAPTLPGSVVWSSGFAPNWSTGASEYDVVEFLTVDAGTTWIGMPRGLNLS